MDWGGEGGLRRLRDRVVTFTGDISGDGYTTIVQLQMVKMVKFYVI